MPWVFGAQPPNIPAESLPNAFCSCEFHDRTETATSVGLARDRYNLKSVTSAGVIENIFLPAPRGGQKCRVLPRT